MNKFINKVILFLFPLFVSAILIEYTLRRIPNDYSFKSEKIIKDGHNFKVLFLGSSHAYYSIQPSLISIPSFNLAQPSQTLDIDWLLYRKYESYLNNLKLIVLPISYFSFNLKIENGVEKNRITLYNIHHKLNVNYCPVNYFDILNKDLFTSLSKIYYNYIQDSSFIRCDSAGWGIDYKYSNRENLINSAAYSARIQTYLSTADSKELTSDLDSIIKHATARNIKTVLYTVPCYPTYLKLLNPLQVANMKKCLATALAKNKDVSFYDFSTSPDFKAEDFHDANHLNEFGATKFSMKIDSVINIVIK